MYGHVKVLTATAKHHTRRANIKINYTKKWEQNAASWAHRVPLPVEPALLVALKAPHAVPLRGFELGGQVRVSAGKAAVRKKRNAHMTKEQTHQAPSPHKKDVLEQ